MKAMCPFIEDLDPEKCLADCPECKVKSAPSVKIPEGSEKMLNYIVKNLAYQVHEIKRLKQDMDKASWSMMRGAIITGEEAELIISVLESK
jgi:hypothetical protein